MIKKLSRNLPEEPAVEKKRHRSPGYPSIGLQEAIEKAEAILKQGGKHQNTLESVAAFWGYTPTSSAVLQQVAALKQFGLVDDDGSKDGRSVQISELALDILYDESGSPGRQKATQTAALTPKIHNELWTMYRGELPASDAPIRVYLLRQKNFNPKAVDDFIKQFRATLAFAGLAGLDKISEGNSDEDEPMVEQDQGAVPRRQRGTGVPQQPQPFPGHSGHRPLPPGTDAGFTPQHGMRDFPLYTAGQRGALYVPESMTAEEFALLKTQIENSLKVIEATAVQKT